MTVPQAIIEVADLSFEYPGLRALDGVGFTISAGSITALVGPNGAGKTTLLRCLAGLQRPLGGRIVVNGVDVIDEPRRSHRTIGFLSDFFGLYDDLTVRQSLHYVGSANGIDAAQIAQVVVETAADFGLSDRLDQRAGTLSRGLRQRVAIAQAVIHRPAVILLDEPAAGLDPEARYALGELFIRLRERGMSLLVSSHILAELEAYSTDMLIVRSGRIIDHQRLAKDVTASTSEILEIGALNANNELAAALEAEPQIESLGTTDDRVRVRFEGDATARAELLSRLITAGHPIDHFSVLAEDLQQSYLRTIANQDAQQNFNHES